MQLRIYNFFKILLNSGWFVGKIKKVLQNLYEILEIFWKFWETFEQILNKFFEMFLFAYSFQINFPNHYVSGKNFGKARAPGPPMVTNPVGGGGQRKNLGGNCPLAPRWLRACTSLTNPVKSERSICRIYN